MSQFTKKVLIIGLEQIGHGKAEYVTEKSLAVHRHDIGKKAIKRAI